MVSELDALGDELLLDDDSSYLDEASAAPSIPEGIPSDSKTNKVTVFGAQQSAAITVTDKSERVVLVFLHVLHLQHHDYMFFKPFHSFFFFQAVLVSVHVIIV